MVLTASLLLLLVVLFGARPPRVSGSSSSPCSSGTEPVTAELQSEGGQAATAAVCVHCVPGKKRAIADTNCTACSPGMFQDKLGMDHCKSCPYGFTDMPQEQLPTACQICAKGTYGKGCTKICPAGRFRPSHKLPWYDGNDTPNNQAALEKANCLACAPGSASASPGSGACAHCFPGMFSDMPGATTCSPCAVDHYARASDSSNCEACAFGQSTHNNTGAATCFKCEAGKTGGKEGGDGNSCTPCAAGKFRGATDPTERCKACSPGLFNDREGAAACIPCFPGRYTDQAHQSQCKKCAINTYTNMSQSVACRSCPFGEATANETGAASCQKCEAGRYGADCLACTAGRSRGARAPADKCEDCHPGFYQEQRGQAICLPCVPGRKQPTSGAAVECDRCPTGRFSDEVSRTNCTECPRGYTTGVSETGAVSCAECPAGRFGSEAARCENCLPGFFRGRAEATDEASNSATACTGCAPGFHQDFSGQTSCFACLPGRYQDRNAQHTCDECAIGLYRPPPSRDKAAKDLSSVETACHTCPRGFESTVTGASSCVECDLGKFGSAPGVCQPCEAGTYNDGKGEMLACKECPENTFSNSLGLTSISECAACATGTTTGGAKRRLSRSACLCMRGVSYGDPLTLQCQQCPVGADCSLRHGATLTELVALPGFWRPDATSEGFVDCTLAYKGLEGKALALERCCPGGQCMQGINSSYANSTGKVTGNATLSPADYAASIIADARRNNGTVPIRTFVHPDEQCSSGYRGPLCLLCDENFVKMGTDCVPCPGGAVFLHAVYSFLTIGIIVLLCTWALLACSIGARKAKRGKRFFGQIKIIISFVQILSTIPEVYDNVPWPSNFLEFVIPMKMINLDFFSVTDRCTLAINFFDKFSLHMLLPPMIFLSAFGGYYASGLCLRTRKQLANREEQIWQVLILLGTM